MGTAVGIQYGKYQVDFGGAPDGESIPGIEDLGVLKKRNPCGLINGIPIQTGLSSVLLSQSYILEFGL